MLFTLLYHLRHIDPIAFIDLVTIHFLPCDDLIYQRLFCDTEKHSTWLFVIGGKLKLWSALGNKQMVSEEQIYHSMCISNCVLNFIKNSLAGYLLLATEWSYQ